MPGFLFHDIIFGPVRSRRLGLSLGINLLPFIQNIVRSTAFIVNADGLPEIWN
jgi:hypothetical protein